MHRYHVYYKSTQVQQICWMKTYTQRVKYMIGKFLFCDPEIQSPISKTIFYFICLNVAKCPTISISKLRSYINWEKNGYCEPVKINYILLRSEVRCSRNWYHIGVTTLTCFASLLTRFCMIRVFTKRYFQKDVNRSNMW